MKLLAAIAHNEHLSTKKYPRKGCTFRQFCLAEASSKR